MDRQVDLGTFQRWMAATIMKSGTDEESIKSEIAQKELSAEEALKFIKPSKTLTQLERLGIYRRMYVLRLMDVLRMDFTAVAEFLGDDDYEEFVESYLQVNPSRSYNLNHLSYNVPDFIKTYPNLRRREFLYQLATVELALSDIFHLEETPVLTKEAIASVAPEVWETAKIKTITAFRLFAFNYNVNDYLEAVIKENKLPKVVKKDTWLVIYRRNYKLWRLPLTKDAYNLLSDIAKGVPLSDAIGNTIEKSDKDPEALQKKVFKWFQDWVSEGFFQAIVTE